MLFDLYSFCRACGHERDHPVTTALPTEDAHLYDVIDVVRDSLRFTGRLSPKLDNELQRMIASLSARGARTLADVDDDLARKYMTEVIYKGPHPRSPSASTQRRRRWAVRTFFEEARRLGYTERAVGMALRVPPGSSLNVRPLTDDEIERCQGWSRATLFISRAPAVLALAEAGGDAGEIAAVRIGDIDLSNGTVHFRGAVGHRERVNQLNPWSVQAIEEWLSETDTSNPDLPLVVRPDTVGASATATISGELRDVLNRAGLHGMLDVQPRSIRAWSAVKVWEQTHNIIDVARWLGAQSLDVAADTARIGWQA